MRGTQLGRLKARKGGIVPGSGCVVRAMTLPLMMQAESGPLFLRARFAGQALAFRV